MAKHSRDRMVVLAAPAPRRSTRQRRARAHASAALGSRRGRGVAAVAMTLSLAVAVGAGATVGRGTGNPSRDVALVDATPSATTAPPLAPTTARTTTPAVVPAAATTPAAASSASSASSAPPAAAATGLAAGGIPVVALQAYQGAAAAMRTANSACGINWPLIASIGRIESNHGRTSGALLVDGTSNPPVMGILLTGGNGFAGIKDTDGGLLDGNAQYDRAIGPMQFIPSTWKMYASDGNGDGKSDPFNIYDAALAAAKYLCKAGGDLRTGAGIQRAVYSYNHDTSYVNRVLALADEYAVAFNENRLPITAVTDAPAPSDSDLPPATVGGGAQTPTATTTPSAPSRPSDSAAPSDSATPTASATASATPTPSSTPSTPPSPSESTTSAAPTASVTSTSPSSSASETPAPTTSASTSPSETSATISTSAAAVSAAPSAS